MGRGREGDGEREGEGDGREGDGEREREMEREGDRASGKGRGGICFDVGFDRFVCCCIHLLRIKEATGRKMKICLRFSV